MANYSPTENPDVVNKVYTGSTSIDLQGYADEYQRIKEDYLRGIATAKADARKLYTDLKPIHDLGLLPSKFNTAYAQLEAFIS